MLPAAIEGDQMVTHMAYTTSYNPQHNQPSWVAYLLTREHALGNLKRKDAFKSDPMIQNSATPDDYKNTGYDKGHLAPNADMNWDPTVQKECFYMSNMSPQLHSLNGFVWSQMEEQVRQWAIAYDSIYVVTGPVLNESTVKECRAIIRQYPDGSGDTQWVCTTLIDTREPFKILVDNKTKKEKKRRVSVPDYFYKIAYCPARGEAIAFLVPHDAPQKALMQSYVVSINTVELVTGIDFFPELDDDVEEEVESRCCLECWEWKNLKIEK